MRDAQPFDPTAQHGHERLQPLVVVVRATTQCGLACRYCGFSREVPLERREINADELLAFGHGLSEYQTATARPVLVSWLGGEPYQWSQLWQVSKRFQQLKLSLGITTNGSALASHGVRQQTLQCFDQLTLSVDGLAEDHDTVRQTPRGYLRLRTSCLRLRAEEGSKPCICTNGLQVAIAVGQSACHCVSFRKSSRRSASARPNELWQEFLST